MAKKKEKTTDSAAFRVDGESFHVKVVTDQGYMEFDGVLACAEIVSLPIAGLCVNGMMSYDAGPPEVKLTFTRIKNVCRG